MAIANSTKINSNQPLNSSKTAHVSRQTAPPTKESRLAVLIDAENVASGMAYGLFKTAAQHGRLNIRRAYGNWNAPCQGWQSMLQAYAIMPVQQFRYSQKKNVSDIALIIDAMDLLYSGKVDKFCLVSSDSDFTRLAMRIQEEGLPVIGFGESGKVSDSYMQACDQFFVWKRGAEFEIYEQRWQVKTQLDENIYCAFNKAKQEDGWAQVNRLSNSLYQMVPSFKPRLYGYSKFTDLLKSMVKFEVVNRNGSGVCARDKMGKNGTGPN